MCQNLQKWCKMGWLQVENLETHIASHKCKNIVENIPIREYIIIVLFYSKMILSPKFYKYKGFNKI